MKRRNLTIIAGILFCACILALTANTYTDSGATISCDTWVTVIVEP